MDPRILWQGSLGIPLALATNRTYNTFGITVPTVSDMCFVEVDLTVIADVAFEGF
jgi:hypothetical protein